MLSPMSDMPLLHLPAIFFSKDSSHAYIFISFMLFRISCIVRTLLSVTNMDFHLYLFMSLARENYTQQEKHM